MAAGVSATPSAARWGAGARGWWRTPASPGPAPSTVGDAAMRHGTPDTAAPTPSRARIGPMLDTGLLGPRMTASLSRSALNAAGDAGPRATSTRLTGGCALPLPYPPW